MTEHGKKIFTCDINSVSKQPKGTEVSNLLHWNFCKRSTEGSDVCKAMSCILWFIGFTFCLEESVMYEHDSLGQLVRLTRCWTSNLRQLKVPWSSAFAIYLEDWLM